MYVKASFTLRSPNDVKAWGPLKLVWRLYHVKLKLRLVGIRCILVHENHWSALSNKEIENNVKSMIQLKRTCVVYVKAPLHYVQGLWPCLFEGQWNSSQGCIMETWNWLGWGALQCIWVIEVLYITRKPLELIELKLNTFVQCMWRIEIKVCVITCFQV